MTKKVLKVEIFDVFISGGGIAGLTLALQLDKIGLNVAVVDPQTDCPTPQSAGTRTCAVMTSLLPLIEQTGAIADIQQHCAWLEKMRIVDTTSGNTPKGITFSSDEINEDAFALNIPNDVLRAALFQRAKGSKTLTCFFGETFESLEEHDAYATLTLSNGKRVKTRLLIGADGYNSRVRKALNVDLKMHDYGQTAHTCRLAHTKEHHNISTETYYKDGPFTLVPLTGNTCSLVWLERHENAEKTLRLNKPDFINLLQKNSRGILGTLELIEGPTSVPLRGMVASALIGHRTALIAEAAHAYSPVGAQGLNTSLRDIETLVNLIKTHAMTGLDIGSQTLLQKYEETRLPDMQSRFNIVNTLGKTIATKSLFMKVVRGGALSLLNDSPALRKLAMQSGFAGSA